MSRTQNPAELRAKGTALLVRELGYEDTVRFLLQFSNGQGDYTAERDHLLVGLTLDELIAEGDRLAAQQRASGGGTSDLAAKA